MDGGEYDLEDRLVAYKDFLHTMGVCLEELRESRIWPRIIARRSLLNDTELSPVLSETE